VTISITSISTRWRLLYCTDGSGNEEKEPDAHYRWTATR
jgi:hypothetical protein